MNATHAPHHQKKIQPTTVETLSRKRDNNQTPTTDNTISLFFLHPFISVVVTHTTRVGSEAKIAQKKLKN